MLIVHSALVVHHPRGYSENVRVLTTVNVANEKWHVIVAVIPPSVVNSEGRENGSKRVGSIDELLMARIVIGVEELRSEPLRALSPKRKEGSVDANVDRMNNPVVGSENGVGTSTDVVTSAYDYTFRARDRPLGVCGETTVLPAKDATTKGNQEPSVGRELKDKLVG